MKAADGARIKEAVKKRYGELVGEGSGCCCGPAEGTPAKEVLGGKLAGSAGYADQDLAGLPGNALANAFGCGNPLGFAGVEEGQTVLDIGSGAGIDCFIAAKKVGRAGRVIGIDMTEEMLERARENARAGGYRNVEFLQGEAESMPVPDASVDWVISNCVINLSPDKPAVFSEIARVLRPGGRFSISDIVTAKELPPEIATDLSAWAGCIAGAIPETAYLDGLRGAGLRDVEVVDRIVYDETTLKRFLGCCVAPLDRASGGGPVGGVGALIWSARIVGRK